MLKRMAVYVGDNLEDVTAWRSIVIVERNEALLELRLAMAEPFYAISVNKIDRLWWIRMREKRWFTEEVERAVNLVTV